MGGDALRQEVRLDLVAALEELAEGTLGDVEDLGGAAVFLASEASCFVNGHILYVDGGVTATL